MKKLVLYLLIIAGLLMIPVEKEDIGVLEPIQAVWLSSENGNVVLQTDTGDKGSGGTVTEALQDMKLCSQGVVYLDTAQFLLVSADVVSRIPEIKTHLKGSVRVCLWDGEGTVADAARYMQAHKLGYRLSHWQVEVKIPNLPA